METALVVVLLVLFGLLFGEVLHCKVIDWREMRDVQNVWEGCIAVTRASEPSWVADRAIQREARKLFQLNKERRAALGRPLPSHLIGIPAAELIARYA